MDRCSTSTPPLVVGCGHALKEGDLLALFNDYSGGASRQLSRRAADAGPTSIIVGVRYMPLHFLWLVDRIVTLDIDWVEVEIFVDDDHVGQVSSRRGKTWQPLLVPANPGDHEIGVRTRFNESLITARVRVELGQVVSVLFTPSPMSGHSRPVRVRAAR